MQKMYENQDKYNPYHKPVVSKSYSDMMNIAKSKKINKQLDLLIRNLDILYNKVYASQGMPHFIG